MLGSRVLDLNADLGEGYANDDTLLSIVTSANVACGGHAGDRESMRRTVSLAKARGVSIGAHPSYPDREGFGRRPMVFAPTDIEDFVAEQTRTLVLIARESGAQVDYCKPHGALGNLSAKDPGVAEACARAVHAVDPAMGMLAFAGSALEMASRAIGLPTYGEIYADRAYDDTGALLSRTLAGAVIEDQAIAVTRLRGFLRSGFMPTASGATVRLEADSVCVHGDSAHAVSFARDVRLLLVQEGFMLRPFCGPLPAP